MIDTCFVTPSSVPSTSPASLRYAVGDGALVVPPNNLVRLGLLSLAQSTAEGATAGAAAPLEGKPAFRHFVVVGAGKTGVDVVLWLLRNGACTGWKRRSFRTPALCSP